MFCLTGNKDACYLAPEAFKRIGTGRKNVFYDVDLADVWSLGLTILSAVILRNVSSIYTFYPPWKVDSGKLNMYLGEAKRLAG